MNGGEKPGECDSCGGRVVEVQVVQMENDAKKIIDIFVGLCIIQSKAVQDNEMWVSPNTYKTIKGE